MDDTVEPPINHKLHVFLIILTVGVWLIPYLMLVLARTMMEVDDFFALVARNQKLLNNRLERDNTPES